MLQPEGTDVDSNEEPSGAEVASIGRGQNMLITSSNVEVSERRNSSESFYSAQLLEPSTNFEDMEEIVEASCTVRPTVDFQDEGNQGSANEKIEPGGDSSKDHEARPKFSQISKVERMEALLEQLIVLNVNQATKESTPAYSEATHSARQPEAMIADNMLNELLALRSEIQVKTEKDENLRNEISLLRQQLEQADSKTETEGKIKKLRDLFWISARKAASKKSNDERGNRQAQIEGKQSYSSKSKSIQFSSNSPHEIEEMPTKSEGRLRATSFDVSNDDDSSSLPLRSAGRELGSAASFDSSFRSGGDVLNLSRQKKYLVDSGNVSAQSFDGDRSNDFFLQQQLEGSMNSQTEQEAKKKVTKLKNLLRFGRKNRTTS
ncbi:MAG: hypothetical protein SGBAC_007762 [Bacillariaceae sp.]